MKIRSSICCETGRIRTENQDRLFADDQLGLFIVADGIGGGPHGAVAAEIVVQVLPTLMRRWLGEASPGDNGKTSTTPLSKLEDQLKSDLCQVSEQLREDSQGVPGLDGMGSTAAVLAFAGNRIITGHLGDSRIYRLREGQLSQVTVDHSVAQVLMSTGELTEDDAVHHPSCTRLTRFVGMPSPTLPTTTTHLLQAGDRFLLCTDGVSGALPVSLLASLLNDGEAETDVAERLVRSAVEYCGSDNATAVVVDVSGDVAGSVWSSEQSTDSRDGVTDA